MRIAVGSLMRAFGIFAGIQLFASIIKNTFALIKTFDSLKFAMEKIVDTTLDLESSQRFLLKISQDYGVELLATSQRYVKFLASAKQVGLSLNDTEKIFGSVTKAASVLGLKTDELTGVYLALEQMLSKGKVTTEELRRQLGERLPGAMGIMAAALDVTIPKLDEMLKKGQVLSADALPKFAVALELAFGVTNLKKVNTLAAAQNRLATSWQLFVKDIGEGENGLSKFFTTAFGYLNEWISKMASITGSPALVLQKKIIDEERAFQTLLDLQAKGIYVERFKALEDFQKEKLKLFEISNTDYFNYTKEEKKIHDEKIRDILGREKIQQSKLNVIKKEIAEDEISTAISVYQKDKFNFENSKKLLAEHLAELAELQRKHSESGNAFSDMFDLDELKERQLVIDKIDAERLSLNDLTDAYATSTAAYDIQRKLLQESNVDVPDEDDDSSKGKADTSEIDARIEELKTVIVRLNQLRNSSGANVTDQLKYTKNILEHETSIIDLEYQKRIKILKKAALDEKTTKEMTNAQQVIANEKLTQDIIKEEGKRDKKKQEILDKYFNEEQKKAENYYKTELKNKIDAIDQKEMTVKEYNAEVAKITLEFYNTELEKQIAFIEAQIILLELEGQAKVDAENRVLALKAKIRAKGFLGNEKELETDLEHYQRKLELASEFADGLADIFNSVMDSRLEAIDAEIDAEEKKYNRLISLAENDESRKAALEEEKQNRLDQLEKKRLKSEQRAVIANKAFAIAQIAINTAIGISKAGTKGFFGIPEIAWLKILAGLQVAAVLAAPIPQYADGVDNLGQNETAMINDGGKKEYVERNGQILSTNTRNAIVDLKKGDTVHKDYDSMIKNSMVYSVVGGGANFSQFEFDRLSNTIEDSISKGFNKAKINNKLTINNSSSNSYLRQKARY